MSAKTKVLVIDDSAFNRQTIKKMLENSPGIEVVGTASNGMEAMAKTLRLQPDVITLDFEMPEMDGFSFLRWLMHMCPTPVIMVSSHDDQNTVFRALELGAVDFISKPGKRASLELQNIERDLLNKINSVRQINMEVVSKNVKLHEEHTETKPSSEPIRSDVALVAIGSSTGGPPALQMVLQGLPSDFPSSIVISQHMPRGFTKSLSERLNRICALHVKEAEQGEVVEPATVYICPGGHHMAFRQGRDDKGLVLLAESQSEDKYTPSVNTMMISATKVYGKKICGVVLTGMGDDGMEGMVEIVKAGGYTIAESEETAVVYGMPREVMEAGAARDILPINEISAKIVEVVMGDRRKR